MSNLQTYYHFKLDFQKVNQHRGGKWLIQGTKRRKDNQLQSLELPCVCTCIWYVIGNQGNHVSDFMCRINSLKLSCSI